MDSGATSVAYAIIQAQYEIMGPVSFSLAKKVQGLSFDGDKLVKIEGDPKVHIGELVSEYERYFGRASVEVCKEAVSACPVPDKDTFVPTELLH